MELTSQESGIAPLRTAGKDTRRIAMPTKPTYAELEHKIAELESQLEQIRINGDC